MKLRILFLFLLFSLFSNAQTSKFSVEAAYPLPIDQNFLGDHFNGIGDLGLKYRIKNLQVINIGVSVNGSMYTYDDTVSFAELPVSDFKTTLYMIQPRAWAEINLKKIIKIHPFAGIGYTFLMAKRDFDSDAYSDDSTSQSGVNLNVGLSYDIFPKVYLFGSYDYTMLTELDGAPSTTYNTKASVLKLGVGVRL